MKTRYSYRSVSSHGHGRFLIPVWFRVLYWVAVTALITSFVTGVIKTVHTTLSVEFGIIILVVVILGSGVCLWYQKAINSDIKIWPLRRSG
jgi:membrane protein DedA with SNARE-associated domain